YYSERRVKDVRLSLSQKTPSLWPWVLAARLRYLLRKRARCCCDGTFPRCRIRCNSARMISYSPSVRDSLTKIRIKRLRESTKQHPENCFENFLPATRWSRRSVG